ncbi:zinc-ribbon domain-containing protein [Streptomyces lydicus]|uniref:zinc-ribbon domain-containing protein n=1 Tax=Streptomyces lydicus TaxID=47763 RepID=UPI0036CB176B
MRRKDVAEDWDYELNFPHTPDKVSVSSSTRMWWWKCRKGKHPSYKARVSTRTRSRFPAKCPKCPRAKKIDAYVTDANRLSVCRRDLIASWNVKENLPLTPDLVSVFSGKRVIWDCLANPDHPSWPAAVADRAGSATREGTGCPECYLVGTSRPELRLKAELSLFLSITPGPARIPAGGKRLEEVDIADHSARLVVEFDGAYSHSQPGSWERDREKTRRLTGAGWTVVRVREHDLEKIDPVNDVAVGKDAHPYRVATAVIKHLANLGFLSSAQAEKYSEAGDLRAREVSDAWIFERLGRTYSKAELDTYDDKWDRMHKALVSFHEAFGHCRVPAGIEVKGVDLRTWCYTQRDFHRKGKLSKERQQRLEGILFWHFDALAGNFWDNYEMYQEIFNWRGTGQRIPGADAQDVRAMQQWAKKLRERRRKQLAAGKDLPSYQVEAMGQISGWSWSPKRKRS